jgi:hypothetical protein
VQAHGAHSSITSPMIRAPPRSAPAHTMRALTIALLVLFFAPPQQQAAAPAAVDSGSGRGSCPQLVPGQCSPRCGKDPRYRCTVLSTIPCADPKVCCAACLANPQCEFFTLTVSRQLCHLKTNSTQLSHGNCASGRLRGTAPPPAPPPGPPRPPAPPGPPGPPPPSPPPHQQLIPCWANTSLARLPFCNPSISHVLRARDLVQRLTLDEKVAQLVTQAAAVPRLGVDRYDYDQECNSGVGVGYPQNIGMAASWNRSLLFAAGRGTGSMLRARANAARGSSKKKALNCWSPMINIMRSPLWGRNHEGFGGARAFPSFCAGFF